MSLFLSSYENRLDTKGRISVPASFRASLNNEKFAGNYNIPHIIRQIKVYLNEKNK